MRHGDHALDLRVCLQPNWHELLGAGVERACEPRERGRAQRGEPGLVAVVQAVSEHRGRVRTAAVEHSHQYGGEHVALDPLRQQELGAGGELGWVTGQDEAHDLIPRA
jgi:hypothetical protein